MTTPCREILSELECDGERVDGKDRIADGLIRVGHGKVGELKGRTSSTTSSVRRPGGTGREGGWLKDSSGRIHAEVG